MEVVVNRKLIVLPEIYVGAEVCCVKLNAFNIKVNLKMFRVSAKFVDKYADVVQDFKKWKWVGSTLNVDNSWVVDKKAGDELTLMIVQMKYIMQESWILLDYVINKICKIEKAIKTNHNYFTNLFDMFCGAIYRIHRIKVLLGAFYQLLHILNTNLHPSPY